MVRQIKNEKNIVPPVAQFQAFSVYEDKEAEVKKRDTTFKFVSKDTKKDNNFFVTAAESTRALCAQVEKQALAEKKQERQKEAPPVRYVEFQLSL